MKTLLQVFNWLRRLAFVFLLMGIAGHAMGAKTYSDNGDGTVTDPTTGLVWMRCEMGQTWDGKTCTGTASTYTFDQANALTGTTSFANHSDWRLPNIRELQTIVDRSVSNPAIGSVFFGNDLSDPAIDPFFSGTNLPAFWSASTIFGWSTAAWCVHFFDGGAFFSGKDDILRVRLVRGGQFLHLLDMARPTSDYVDNADGTVTHTPTGLMWQRCAVGQTLNAAGRCAGIARTYTWDQVKTVSSRLSGYTDWRLPTEDELISLVDYKTLMPALNARIFPDTPLGLYGESSNFWSASTFVGPSDCSWMVTFSHGVVGAACGNPGGAFQVRLVRTVNGVTPSTQGESLTLAASWNLLGNGRNQPLPVASVFGDATRVTTVWKWDVANSGWQFYAPSMKAQELQN